MSIAYLLLLTTACSDYSVSTIEQEEQLSWFEEQSQAYQDGYTPDGDEADTGVDEDLGDTEEESPDDAPEDQPPAPEDQDESEDDQEDDDYGSDDDDSWDWDEDWDEDEDDSDGTTEAVARSPLVGEAVITELHIHPQSTPDAQGEWIEIRNVSSAWLDLEGAMLADRGVDAVEIEALGPDSLKVGPGDFIVLCAEDDYWDNGGVDCHGTFYYWTMGGGFALSNTEDEVKLISESGWMIDEVRYSEGFAEEGIAMGLRSERTSSHENDNMSNWCEQSSFMPFGDSGTPGEQNDSCW